MMILGEVWGKVFALNSKNLNVYNTIKEFKMKMNASLKFIKATFFGLIIVSLITYWFKFFPNNPYYLNVVVGGAVGLAFGSLFLIGERILSKINIRTFNAIALGALFGVIMSKAILLLFENLFYFLLGSGINENIFGFIETLAFLSCGYLGIFLTVKNSENLSMSIPFFNFHSSSKTENFNSSFVISSSALSDPRTIELASSGLLGAQAIVPKFLMSSLNELLSQGDEIDRSRTKKMLDLIKKLENVSGFSICYHDKNFPDTKDLKTRCILLAKHLKACLLVADSSHLNASETENLRVVNINTIANALKPIMSAGEFLKIKIQRYGKETNQGIGYLENGTMVVVNGGGDYLGEVIDARVLSVKHTHSGRMIFCNVNEDEDSEHMQCYSEGQNPYENDYPTQE